LVRLVRASQSAAQSGVARVIVISSVINERIGSPLFFLDGMNSAAAADEAMAIVFVATPGIWVAMARRSETALGFVIATSVAQAIVILVFAALFAGVALAIGAVDFVAFAVVLYRCALRGAVTPLLGSRWEVFVAYRCASSEHQRNKEWGKQAAVILKIGHVVFPSSPAKPQASDGFPEYSHRRFLHGWRLA
jgi:hypothetical protein